MLRWEVRRMPGSRVLFVGRGRLGLLLSRERVWVGLNSRLTSQDAELRQRTTDLRDLRRGKSILRGVSWVMGIGNW